MDGGTWIQNVRAGFMACIDRPIMAKHLHRHEHAASHEDARAGEYVEVLNNALCGAKNVVGTLRWVKAGERYDAANDARTNQLIYLMEGEATITLNAKVARRGEGQRDLSGAVGVGEHRAAGHRPAQTLPVGRTETGSVTWRRT